MKPIRAKIKYYNNILMTLRERKGLSQTDLALKLGYALPTYNAIERFRASPKTTKGVWRPIAVKLAEFWQISEEYLFPLLEFDDIGTELELNAADVMHGGLGISCFWRELPTPEEYVLQKEEVEQLIEAKRAISIVSQLVLAAEFEDHGYNPKQSISFQHRKVFSRRVPLRFLTETRKKQYKSDAFRIMNAHILDYFVLDV